MTSMQEIVDTEMIRHLVSRDITCVHTGRVLDVRTCLVIRDAEGDPAMVLDPSCAENDKLKAVVEAKGWTLEVRGKP